MKITIKTVIAAILLAMLGMAVSTDSLAGTDRLDSRTNRQIRACIDEIGRRSDYSGALRVTHLIVALTQRNLEELEIAGRTSIRSDDGTRSYSFRCVTGTMGELVQIRVGPAH